MIRAFLMAALALLVAGPARADGPVLWRDIAAGMPRSAVHALYPAGKGVKHRDDSVEVKPIQITEQCEAELNVHFNGDVVERIVLKGNPSMGGRCSDTVLSSLSAKYGQPLSDSNTERSVLAREGRIYVWTRDGVTLRFKRFSNGAFAGGGLLAASWELTYSAAEAVADL